jgi:hypothetical protein
MAIVEMLDPAAITVQPDDPDNFGSADMTVCPAAQLLAHFANELHF